MTNRVVPVYASTLTWSDTGEPLTADERSVVGPRMVAGLRAMWIRAKLLD